MRSEAVNIFKKAALRGKGSKDESSLKENMFVTPRDNEETSRPESPDFGILQKDQILFNRT